jgi:hypothetical protein
MGHPNVFQREETDLDRFPETKTDLNRFPETKTDLNRFPETKTDLGRFQETKTDLGRFAVSKDRPRSSVNVGYSREPVRLWAVRWFNAARVAWASA